MNSTALSSIVNSRLYSDAILFYNMGAEIYWIKTCVFEVLETKWEKWSLKTLNMLTLFKNWNYTCMSSDFNVIFYRQGNKFTISSKNDMYNQNFNFLFHC